MDLLRWLFRGIRSKRGSPTVEYVFVMVAATMLAGIVVGIVKSEPVQASLRQVILCSVPFLYDENGQCYISKNRVKTEIPFISVILPDGMEILKKYNFQLPLISIEKVNAYLKIIQDLSDINKPLHTHIARHTYATRCLNAGVRIEVVSKLLGHTNIRQTQHYAKLLKNSIVDEVSRCFKK